METNRHFEQLPTWFLGAETGEELFRVDDGVPLLAIGSGVLLPGGGERYRVVDTWISFDDHGRFHEGQHVFLALVSGTEDDRLGHVAD